MISMIQNNILWSPLQIGGLTTKNRFAVLPMECADAAEGGHLSQDMQMRYDRYAEGGAGLVFLEAVTLQHETRSRDRQLLLDVYKKESREEWERFVASFKAKHPNTLLIFQYHHAGETAGKEFSRRVTVKPLTPFGGELIDAWYIDDYIHRQVETAKFLYRIGVDGIDLKFCHGYLGSQLLRPYNDRDWKYGGSWENRSRFAFETCERIRRAVPDPKFLIGARVSMYEEMPGGQGHAGADSFCYDLSESIALLQGLEARGCSYFGETIGNASVYWENMAPSPSCSTNVYQHLTMAKTMKEVVQPQTVIIGAGMSVLGDGTHNQLRGVQPERTSLLHVAEDALQNGVMDMVGLGRQALANPYLPCKVQSEQASDVQWCLTCNLCSELEMRGKPIGCAVYNTYFADLLKECRSEFGAPSQIVTGD